MGRRRDPIAAASLAIAVLALAAGAASAQHRAHVHGEAMLRIAVEGAMVAIELEAPLESLIGFERAPRTAAERTAVAALRARFAKPGELFVLDAEARCTVTASELSAPSLDGKPAEGDHAELTATVTATCALPAKLRTLDVRLFADHPNLARIRVEAVGPGGATRRELRRGATTVSLGRSG